MKINDKGQAFKTFQVQNCNHKPPKMIQKNVVLDQQPDIFAYALPL